MFDQITESFLAEFFLFDVILGNCFDRRAFFFELSDVFCLPSDNLDDLYEAIEREAVRDVVSVDMYNRYLRIYEYHRLTEEKPCDGNVEHELISIKGNALRIADRFELTANGEVTEILIAKKITDSAQAGNILSLRMLGMMQCGGFLLKKDLCEGLENLTKAMRWGDISAALGLLRYSEGNRTDTIKVLNALVERTPFEFFLHFVENRYGVCLNGEQDETMLLVKKALSAKKIKRDVYDSLYARLLFSNLLSIKDKERIIFSERKELLSEACDLPLHLSFCDIPIDESAVKNLILNRENEREAILRGIRNADIRALNTFRPICLSSESGYVLDRYEIALCEALKTSHIERVTVDELREYDVEPTKNNVFVRGLDERKSNVCLLVFQGDTGDGVVDYVKSFLKSDRRRHFRLNYPAVEIDLSSVLPICICDKQNARKIREYVELIQLAPVQAEEKDAVLREILERKARSYSIGIPTVTAEIVEQLRAMPVENVESVLETAIRNHRVKGKAFQMTADMIQNCSHTTKDDRKTVYGFGGVINESR